MKTIALSIVILLGSVAGFAANKGNLIYNSEEKDGLMVAQTVYKMDGGSLENYLKYNYQYDDQKRVIENETLKWNNSAKKWDNDLCIRYAYEGKTVTTTYYKWNHKQKQYILVP